MAANNTPSRWRNTYLIRLILGGWIVIACRLIHLQWHQAPQLEELAKRQSEIVVEVPARPADIVDRNGKVLAGSINSQSLFVDPKYLNVEPEFIAQLSQTLSLDANDLQKRLNDYKGKRFCWIKRRLTEEEVQSVLALDWPRHSFGFRAESVRQYPQDALAAHVLGLRNIDGQAVGGVEKSLDHLIRGESGRRKLIRDARNRIMEVDYSPEDAPRQFQAVQLTIDSSIQAFVERSLDELAAEWQPTAATAIVMIPQSGEVLALASWPSYSPNRLDHVDPAAWKNQAISIVYEPGSTFKPVVVAWALQSKAVAIDDIFDCRQNPYRMSGGRLLRDISTHGIINLPNGLVKSSNIMMAQIGERLTNDRLYEAVSRFGFGRPTGIELPGELSGILHPLEKWTSYSTGSIPMGQEIAVTPMQLITATAAIANGGRLVTPHLLKGVMGDGTEMRTTYMKSPNEPRVATPPQIATQTVDPEIANWLIQTPMADVVRRGTGIKARVPGYSVFGKTGTAQKYDPQTGTYSASKFTVSFVGGAPVQDPKFIVLVVVDEPHTKQRVLGGKIAAPVAGKIIQESLRHLHIPPDGNDNLATHFDEFDMDTLIE